MSRTLTGTLLTETNTPLGTEPIIIVKITWGRTTNTVYYSDKVISGATGKILSLGGIDSVVKLKGGGQFGSVTITLDDLDGSIKTILNNNDIQKVPVVIYHTTQVAGFSGKVKVFHGEINTPISWSENDQNVTFNIANLVEYAQIGYSPDQGAFPRMAESAIGKAWPLCFGSVIRVPAVKATEQYRGTCLTRYSVVSKAEAKDLEEKSVIYASALRSKTDAGTLTEDELIVYVRAINTAYIDLLNLIETLIFEAPNKEETIREYSDLSVEIADKTASIDKLEQELLELNTTKDETELQRATLDLQRNGLLGLADPSPSTILAIDQLNQQIAALDATIAQLTAQIAAKTALKTLAETQLATLESDKALLLVDLIDFNVDTIIVDGGENFPQGTPLEVIIKGLRLRGSFSGRTFTISDRNLPTYRDLEFDERLADQPNLLWLKDITKPIVGHYCFIKAGNDYKVIYVQGQGGARCAYNPILWEPDGADFMYYRPAPAGGLILETSPIFRTRWLDHLDEADGEFNGLNNLPDSDFGIDIGDDIYLADDYQDTFIANLIPSTQVKEVLAFRTIRGNRTLQPLPSSRYFVNLNDSIGGQHPTTIKFKRPLRDYQGENWEDQIYVTLVSSVGSNTVDQISYLVATYGTGLTEDSASFLATKSKLANYPSNFALLERKDLLATLEEIAWQARSTIWVNENVVYLRYLSQKTAPTASLSEDDVESLSVSYSETEGLVTEFVANWTKDYSRTTKNQVILRNNTKKYGLISREFEFYIYNIEELVIKSATFWMLRYSNTWKKVQCRVFLTKLKIETLDIVSLNFTNQFVATGIVDAEVESATYDSDARAIDLVLWVPVKSGSMSEYRFAWPGSADTSYKYPDGDDLWAGGSADGQLIQASVYVNETRPRDLGSIVPGDANEVAPPPDPTIGHEPIDYQPKPDNKANVVQGETVIDIQTTRIVDSVNGGATTLSTGFAIGKITNSDEQAILLKNNIGMSGQVGINKINDPTDHGYDSTDKKWRPKGTFLRNDL